MYYIKCILEVGAWWEKVGNGKVNYEFGGKQNDLKYSVLNFVTFFLFLIRTCRLISWLDLSSLFHRLRNEVSRNNKYEGYLFISPRVNNLTDFVTKMSPSAFIKARRRVILNDIEETRHYDPR